MFGMGWAELMIVGIVALIVVGPKELPTLFRKIGNAVGKARGMAREFSRAMNDAADQSGMKGAMDSVNSMADTVREPTKAWTNYTPGSETEKLAKERKENADKLRTDAAARQKALKERKAEMAADAAPKTTAKKPATKKPATKKPATKKAPAKKAAAKKPAAVKKPAAKKA